MMGVLALIGLGAAYGGVCNTKDTISFMCPATFGSRPDTVRNKVIDENVCSDCRRCSIYRCWRPIIQYDTCWYWHTTGFRSEHDAQAWHDTQLPIGTNVTMYYNRASGVCSPFSSDGFNTDHILIGLAGSIGFLTMALLPMVIILACRRAKDDVDFHVRTYDAGNIPV